MFFAACSEGDTETAADTVEEGLRVLWLRLLPSAEDLEDPEDEAEETEEATVMVVDPPPRDLGVTEDTVAGRTSSEGLRPPNFSRGLLAPLELLAGPLPGPPPGTRLIVAGVMVVLPPPTTGVDLDHDSLLAERAKESR